MIATNLSTFAHLLTHILHLPKFSKEVYFNLNIFITLKLCPVVTLFIFMTTPPLKCKKYRKVLQCSALTFK